MLGCQIRPGLAIPLASSEGQVATVGFGVGTSGGVRQQGGRKSVQLPPILRVLFCNTLKAYIDKVEIVCKYRAKCSVLFLNGWGLTCKREEVGALETGPGACGWSWKASFRE